jgi:FkbM family methyltransferase
MTSFEDQLMQTPEGWWVLKSDTHLSRWIEQAGMLDHDQPVLKKLAPYISRGSTVIDCGAALGDHTIFYLQKVGAQGQVIAFEPHPLQFECLRRNCPQAICYRAALGDREDSVWLFHQPDIVAGSRLIDPALQWPMSQVARTRLDQILGRLDSPISFIKIDVEGCETEVLRGANRTIMTHRPVIWCELNPIALERQHSSVAELGSALEELRYRVAEFYPAGADWNGYEGNQCDLLCLPEPT